MNNMKSKSLLRQIGQILVGYFTVSIFVLSFFLISSHATNWFGLQTPLSETTVLAIAVIIVTPLMLPLVLERISKFKLFDFLEVDLRQVSEKVEENPLSELLNIELINVEIEIKNRPSELEHVPEISSSSIEETYGNPIINAFNQAETTGVIEVNLGIGKSWLLSRLFLLAALADDYTGIRQMIFLEDHNNLDRLFIGSAPPASIRQCIACDNQRLKEAYEIAKEKTTQALDKVSPDKEIVWIAWNYVDVLRIQDGKESQGWEELQDGEVSHGWVTPQFLDRCVHINKYRIEWNDGPPTPLLFHQILDRTEPYVFLVSSDGKLNLVIDRLKLAERIAKDTLSRRLE